MAATGGHLKQLHHLHKRLADVSGPYHWATFDRPQSRSLLAGENVDFVRYIGTRDAKSAMRGLPEANRIIAREQPDTIVSTGSAVALPFFAAGRAHGVRCLYVESAARSQGPSVTGRLISAIPGVELHTQYPRWAGRRWKHREAVFDAFEPYSRPAPVIRRVAVTLGTMTFPYHRLIRRLRQILPPDVEVFWQTGATDVSLLGVEGHEALPEEKMSDVMRWADVVVAHAGVGSALAALEVGRVPVLVPRRASFGEHIDDHQEMIAGELDRRGLAVNVEADRITLDDLIVAAARGVRPMEVPMEYTSRRIESLPQAAA